MEKEETSASLWIGDFHSRQRRSRRDRADEHCKVLGKLVPKEIEKIYGGLASPETVRSIRSLTSKHQTRYVLMIENDADA